MPLVDCQPRLPNRAVRGGQAFEEGSGLEGKRRRLGRVEGRPARSSAIDFLTAETASLEVDGSGDGDNVLVKTRRLARTSPGHAGYASCCYPQNLGISGG
jgi:hypothetical protein